MPDGFVLGLVLIALLAAYVGIALYLLLSFGLECRKDGVQMKSYTLHFVCSVLWAPVLIAGAIVLLYEYAKDLHHEAIRRADKKID